MIVLHEVTDDGARRLELVADDVAVVSRCYTTGRTGTEVRTIDGRVFRVRETTAEVFMKLEESDDEWGQLA